MTRVIHVRDADWSDPNVVYIGRKPHGRMAAMIPVGAAGRDGLFGNPHNFRAESNRAKSIALFERFARGRIEWHAGFRDGVRSLHGKTLACWCAPKPCHGDVLVKIADELSAAQDAAS